MRKRGVTFVFLFLLVLLAAAAGNWLYWRDFRASDSVVALGVTHFTGMEIDGSETDSLVVDQNSTGDIVEFRDDSTVVWRLADGGAVTAAGAINQTLVNAAGGSANPYDFTGTLGIMDGSDSFTLFDVNITNADHTGSSNTVTALDIAGITADTHATEDAISIGAGWDSDLNFVTSGQVSVDDVALLVLTDPPAPDAATTTELVEIVATSPVDTTGTNVVNAFTIDLAVGNASGGTNSLRALNVDAITGDAEVTETAINVGTGWDVGLNVGSGGAVIVGDSQYRNSATGSVLLDFRDYADTTDDDMAHALITVNCTDASTGAEDCDYSVGVVEGGAAADTRFSIDADGGVTVGSAANNLVTITTDSTGDGELVLPGESVSAGEITNLTRSIPLPLHAWVPCADGIWDSSGADAEPDLVATPSSTLAIVYDDTGGSVDTGTICTSFTVPADYASGGSFVARLTQDAATGANVETFSCAIAVDGAALGAANAGNNADQTAVQSVTSTPTGTWAAGAAIQVACSQGNASADDTVNFHSIEAQYTATQ